jgi:uncharacterized protein YbjT (DUF2867 family)
MMPTLLIIGATGLVGRCVLRQAMVDERFTRIVAPTRRRLDADVVSGTTRVENPVVDFESLPAEAEWWRADAAICTLGTTIKRTGSKEAFRRVDFEFTLAAARLAHHHGVRTFVLTSSVGADPRSFYFYLRTKGELEKALAACGFDSLTLVRPASLDGERAESRPMEKISLRLLRAIAPITPRRYRPVHAERVAKTLLDSAIEARPGVHTIESEAMQPR